MLSVSLKQAKRLLSIGYNGAYSKIWHMKQGNGVENAILTKPSGHKSNSLPAPYLEEAAEWLRNEKGIHALTTPYLNSAHDLKYKGCVIVEQRNEGSSTSFAIIYENSHFIERHMAFSTAIDKALDYLENKKSKIKINKIPCS